ncbi:GNAT family N-acetyltransferase [Endozoicomonas euniceicola]|uniref:GNAT family N-acetyltransferase n=1 Tax=Endozoicomonas euniceicola TaxID=1234143 RepID=A0ABY6GS26_9GAMM|nr:GNAT family N-acetyltransferase [Endozoicomonas euniceicola]UYM15362.1 GNAT family N-acetyltransferase [Endozoicomonas euniceicola]
MPFECIGMPQGTKFTHRQSANTLKCSRSREDNRLIFQLFEENGGKVVGYVVIKHKFGDFLDDDRDELVYTKGAYGMSLMSVLPSYRSMSLGTLLVFIATREVQANGGRHLYIVNPLSDVFGFYLKLGFHPDPGGDAIRQQKIDEATNFTFLSENFVFATKLQIVRSHNLWRGQVDLLYTILLGKIAPLFQFHQPL